MNGSFTLPKASFHNIKESAQRTYERIQSGKYWIIVFDDSVAAQLVVRFQKYFFPVSKDGFEALVIPMRIGEEIQTALTFLIVSKGKVRPSEMAAWMKSFSDTHVTVDAMNEQDYLFWVKDQEAADTFGRMFELYLEKRKD
jgi:hypothetical protein